ncbi:PadR family transcriptional regulator [Nocardia sp. NPDC049707]|uniref:PadR family transcriptional regulator n=1 Tax=Nocardia sp. NPDC049707 TaxID=3154735 RepID=UPI00341D3AB6
MALRHAVLAALLDGEISGYQLAKLFDITVSNYWHAQPPQLYTELSKLEAEGLVAGREVPQQGRPNKRVYAPTSAGILELTEFITARGKPSYIRDDLLVKVQAADVAGTTSLVAQIEERAAEARAKIERFDQRLRRARDELDEETYLASTPRIGPYLVGLRGKAFEQETLSWCEFSARILKERTRSLNGPTVIEPTQPEEGSDDL